MNHLLCLARHCHLHRGTIRHRPYMDDMSPQGARGTQRSRLAASQAELRVVLGLQADVQALCHVNRIKRLDERRDDGVFGLE
jgi:hypothetical protein